MHTAHGPTASIDPVRQLGDDELIASTQRLLREERKLSARLLEHLAEVDARQLYRQHAYSSMFEYCVGALHLSEAEAYLRIGAARTGRRCPRVLQMLAGGELHLSALKLLAPVLDEANCDELLTAVRFKSKREVELLLAQRRALPDVPSVIRKLPQPAGALEADSSSQTELLPAAPSIASALELPGEPSPQQLTHAAAPPAPAAAMPTQSHTLSPLGADRFKVQFTASKQLHDKLRQAQDLMRHELPDGDIAQVLERALDLLIADRMKKRFAQTTKPRTPRTAPPKPGTRHIPNEVQRQVLERDGTRCTFVSQSGKRCEQRGWLQLHHEHPFARGGAPDGGEHPSGLRPPQPSARRTRLRASLRTATHRERSQAQFRTSQRSRPASASTPTPVH